MPNLILYAFLGALCLFLLTQHARLHRELKRMSRTTKGIRDGNLNLRYRLRLPRKGLENLGGELNRLVDFFQTSLERTRFLEEERKRMIANISHDLRTPLTALLGYMEALRNDDELSEGERDAFLRIASAKGDALRTLLEQFFELAKLEADDDEPELGTVDLAEAARAAALDFYPEFLKSEIVPAVDIPDRTVQVRADETWLRRILHNLLSNALRYGLDGKEIGIGLREEPDRVWVDVWDRGKGISPEDLPHIFERLYTGEASRNAALQGTGLGLTIVRNLVERQGGRIVAKSAPGEKTVFSFCLNRI
ncbi:sensor histidine kinase [Cohnella zeiphila]|uniref:histidine kinase n=1 Tax=Cohnella zeiphila TaxID=2761120 RepID=A0A7X0VVY8_9BACL|nr:HAMP domain-containing sensor histidine kinase [Cohnella zeiphila]MBB6730403.1 HAMP domain-containing histidine kinase [Cohnella zeiphila]